METEIEADTERERIVKLAWFCPEGTSTETGTVAEGVLQERRTVMPPVGARSLKTTVPREVSPPTMVVGLSVSTLSCGPDWASAGPERRPSARASRMETSGRAATTLPFALM